MQVTVTGAGGRTGKLIMQKLLAQPDKFTARGVVRDEKVCLTALILSISSRMTAVSNSQSLKRGPSTRTRGQPFVVTD